MDIIMILTSYDPAHLIPQYFDGITPGLVRAVISIYIVYPLSYVHREFLFRRSKLQQMLYFLLTGSAVIYYVIGLQGLLHCLLNIILAWLTKCIFGPTKTTVIITSAVTMVYLVLGYIANKRVDVYDVWWTTPHSIQTMKLIGLAFDYLDGNTDKDKLQDFQKKNAVKDFTLLEMVTFCFTYTGGIFGPQIPFRRFRHFVENVTDIPTNMHGKPDSVGTAMYKLGVGTCFIALYLPLGVLFNRDTLISPTFNNEWFIYKMTYMIGFGVNALIKYIGCWTVVEGGCVLVGMSYNPDIAEKWDGMRSVDPTKFFFNYRNKDFIDNFNMTTKDWFIRYLFKRNRGLGKWMSMFYTYLFIILWHGVRPGYWLAFIYEIPVILAEKQVLRVVRHYCGPYQTWSRAAQRACFPVAMVTRFVVLGYGTMPFVLLTWSDSAQVYHGLNWFLHIALVSWHVTYHLFLDARVSARALQNGKLYDEHVTNRSVTNGHVTNGGETNGHLYDMSECNGKHGNSNHGNSNHGNSNHSNGNHETSEGSYIKGEVDRDFRLKNLINLKQKAA